jgi:hypothetical protein
VSIKTDHPLGRWKFASGTLAATALIAIFPLYIFATLLWTDYSALDSADPDRPLLYVVIWATCGLTLCLVNLTAGIYLVIWPRIRIIKIMALAALVITITFPGLWFWLWR